MPELAESGRGFAQAVEELAQKFNVEFFVVVAGDFNNAVFFHNAPLEWTTARLGAYHEMSRSQLISALVPRPSGIHKV